MLAGPDFKREQIGFRAFADEMSFIEIALLNEISKNVDGYRLSTFLYKDKESKGGKLTVGPAWDYNLAFGNANYYNGGDPAEWQWNFNNLHSRDFWLNPFWWGRMRQDELHAQRMIDRWFELRSGPWSNNSIMNFIDSMTTVFEKPAERNFERWPVLYQWVWPNVFESGTYQQHIDFMKDWIMDRTAWIDENIPAILLISGVEDQLAESGISIYPNPTEDLLTITSESTFINSLHLIDPLGRLVLQKEGLVREEVIDVSDYPTGVYLLRLVTGDGTFVRKVAIKKQL